MPPKPKVDGAEIARRLANGEAGNQIAKDLGCSRKLVGYYGRKHGVRSRHKAKDPVLVCMDGQWMNLREVSRRYGIPHGTILYRYHRGDRGRRLVRTPMKNRPPDVYELGLSGKDWQIAAEYGREVGTRVAGRRMRIPMGAITAAINGEEDRLG